MNFRQIWHKYWCYLIFIPLLVVAFSFKVGSGWYFHNDGVSLACSMEQFTDLVHLGKWKVKGCTYDHQPLYYLLVKVVRFIAGSDLIIFQWINVVFHLLAWTILTRTLARKSNILFAGAVVFFFMSSFSILYWVQELRMYSLYLLGCFFVVSEIEKVDLSQSISIKKKVFHLFSYFNFFLYLIPLGAYILTYFRLNKKAVSRSFILFVGFLSILVLIKLPFLYWWRVIMRSGEQDAVFGDVVSLFDKGFFQGGSLYIITACVLTFYGVISSFLKDRKNLQTQTYYLLIIATFLLAVLSSVGLQMHEIELRYFLYLYPIVIVLVFKALDVISNRVLKVVMSIVLIAIGFLNSSQMHQRGEPNGGEIKQTAQFVSNLLVNQDEVWTNDPYFYFNYLGVYAGIMNKKITRVKDIRKLKEINKMSYFITVLLNQKEHIKKLEDKKIKYRTIYKKNNFLGSMSIVSEIIGDKNQQ